MSAGTRAAAGDGRAGRIRRETIGMGMGRLTVFAKGNVDVHDSLHSFTLGGKRLWNGINDIVRRRFPGTVVRVRHETMTSFAAVLAADGTVPAEIARRDLRLAMFSAKAQFSAAVFDGDSDAVILSIMSDVATSVQRHREDGYVFVPYEAEFWSAEDRAWVRQSFATQPLVDAATSIATLGRIVERIRRRSQVPILVYNVSAISPGDTVHCHLGLDDDFGTRARRFNLELIELSRRTGISIIDVDTIVARAGADRLKLSPLHLTAEGNRLVAEEVVRVLEDYGCFADTEAA
jgi:hypothetical protein